MSFGSREGVEIYSVANRSESEWLCVSLWHLPESAHVGTVIPAGDPSYTEIRQRCEILGTLLCALKGFKNY
eukprot:scaffold466720_cov36-Prasinocladus_malaysianus.AAC.1